jgi:hypothetical protein
MSKYKLTQDLVIIDKTVLKKSEEIEFDSNDELVVNSELGPIKLTKELLKDKISPLNKDIEFKVSILNDDEDVVNFYRMQLDIKSTRKKVREIESEFRKILNEIL